MLSLSSPFQQPSIHREKLATSATPPLPVADNLITVACHNCHSSSCARTWRVCKNFKSLKLWMLQNLNFHGLNRKYEHKNEFKTHQIEDNDNDQLLDHAEPHHQRQDLQQLPVDVVSNAELSSLSNTRLEKKSPPSQFNVSREIRSSRNYSQSQQDQPFNFPFQGRPAFLTIAVIGATGELATKKIFPALFALYYSGYLPKNFSLFGYSRKHLTDDELRSLIASTLTCRIDQQENCDEKIEAFLQRTYYHNGGYDNRDGMSKLRDRMEQVEGEFGANRIFYLSVPQEALMDVASSLADCAQSQKGWNRIITEKPFGFDVQSSHHLTHFLLSKFEEKQLYRIDHLLGRNTIENLTVLRFSNLVFMPLWNRNYIHNIQVILSEDIAMKIPDSYGIISDVVHSHIFQTIALLAMEPPVTLDGEDVRNEKVKLLRSIRKLETSDVIIGCSTPASGSKPAPTYFAAAMYIDNARWDAVPFMIKVGRGLIRHRAEIRIRFRHVPGNLYRGHIGQNTDLTNNELVLRDFPDEAILARVNNKIPGLGIHLDASQLNLLYKDKYNMELPDSYEQLLHDVVDGDNHLFMRSDEVTAAWNILSPVLHEMDENKLVVEQYELGGQGPDKAIYLWAKHGVRWADD